MATIKLPPGISAQAKEFWPEIQELLEGNDLLFNIPLLQQFMETYCHWKQNLAKVHQEGLIIKTPKGLVESPHLLASERNQKKMTEIIIRYGSTPTNRNDSIEEDATLNDRKRNFIREYVTDHHGAQAAIRAGYSKKGASSKASQLLANVNIKRHIRRLERQITNDINITQEMVYEGFLVEAQGLGPDTTSASRIQAWQQLGKLKGMFREDNAQKSPSLAVLDAINPTALKLLIESLEREIEKRKVLH